jgi:hypothetical protein
LELRGVHGAGAKSGAREIQRGTGVPPATPDFFRFTRSAAVTRRAALSAAAFRKKLNALGG